MVYGLECCREVKELVVSAGSFGRVVGVVLSAGWAFFWADAARVLWFLGLGLEEHVLKDALGGEELELLLKINYYPPCPRPDLALGVVAHTDMSAITMLVPNEVPGLQVFRDDHWFDTKYIPNAIIVHIGDQIEVRTISSTLPHFSLTLYFLQNNLHNTVLIQYLYSMTIEIICIMSWMAI